MPKKRTRDAAYFRNRRKAIREGTWPTKEKPAPPPAAAPPATDHTGALRRLGMPRPGDAPAPARENPRVPQDARVEKLPPKPPPVKDPKPEGEGEEGKGVQAPAQLPAGTTPPGSTSPPPGSTPGTLMPTGRGCWEHAHPEVPCGRLKADGTVCTGVEHEQLTDETCDGATYAFFGGLARSRGYVVQEPTEAERVGMRPLYRYVQERWGLFGPLVIAGASAWGAMSSYTSRLHEKVPQEEPRLRLVPKTKEEDLAPASTEPGPPPSSPAAAASQPRQPAPMKIVDDPPGAPPGGD